MSRESTCRCLICALERSLRDQFSEHSSKEAYRHFADSRSLLSPFPSALELVTYLHTSRATSDGTHPSDAILTELLQATATDDVVLRDLLLLAFIPMLHATFRRVRARYPSLSGEDISQHAVGCLLEILGSTVFSGRTSHLAFAISRLLKRNTFAWAEHECRAPVNGTTPDALSELPSTLDTTEPFERAALLRHFLFRCQQRGLLRGEDLELLVQFKLDATRDREPGGPAALYSNAQRQRMKRLLAKLRRIARTPRAKEKNPNQLRLF